MAISSALAISISIITALCAVVIAAAVHRVLTNRNKGYDDNGVPQSEDWVPNNYPAEQVKRLAEVRWRVKKELWEVARDYRLTLGLGVPDWYPGDYWSYESAQPVPSPTSAVSVSTENFVRTNQQYQDPIERDTFVNQGSPTYAPVSASLFKDDRPYSRVTRYSPMLRRSHPASSSLPSLLKRWTQHGPPRRSRQQGEMATDGVPRIMLNNNDIPLTEFDSYAHAHVSPYPNMPQRTSSVYPEDGLNRSTKQAQQASSERSRVDRMIAQWERADVAH